MAASTRERRISKELSDLQNDPNSGVSAHPVDSSLLHLKGIFLDPPDTLRRRHLSGRHLDTRKLPLQIPVMKFDTKIWHPNVSSVTGAICLDTLGTGWSPVGTIKMALISLRMLLRIPQPKGPARCRGG
ncbi:Ubiquitin-conjugating enzyme E2 1 [Podospora pseudocomata]|uniref:Ubiquitin-conjugating enzyme E2 2 n=1 Tax=Podospora pseudocomata TaxID=2093779 RepID=A0ABR0GR29_9PEZI|nr:Ubiquitin-conjugating enzyme E2 1 [Podospora pseudocomata]